MKTLDLAETYGILGGGQLALMLVAAAKRLGIHPHVFCGSPEDPVARLGTDFLSFGSLQDPVALARFLAPVDHVVFESEFVSRSVLESAVQLNERSRNTRLTPIRFSPSLSVIERVQSKLNQKKLFDDLGLPTSPWFELDLNCSNQELLKKLEERFPASSFVLKVAEGGYDGKGNWLPGTTEQIDVFLDRARKKNVRVYAEKQIPFRRELALVAVRSSLGEWTSYPAVITFQERGICRWVEGPAEKLDVALKLTQEMQTSARKVAERLDLVGAYALEFFETQSGELIINEMAPRVHNSGHFTQDLCEASQFENHWRAVTGMPLGRTEARAAFFGMWNSLGPDSALPEQTSEDFSIEGEGIWHHDYQKKDCRPGRKMGHWNVSAESLERLRERREKVRLADQAWFAARGN